ncbi:sensor histidine kinase [Thioclava sp. FR2]|uniref:sensor histidine kinase n=1 Tax=Thioclava sp. FR2 TaxID=3445780 RepID=UPI003EBE6D74
MTLMGAALLPLAVLSYVQTLAAERVAESRARAAILGETLLAAAPQIDMMMQAQGAVDTLAATFPQIITDPEICSDFVNRTAQSSAGRYSFVGFIPPDGMITCTSADEAFDLSDSPWLAEMVAVPQSRLTVNRNGPISGTSILNFSAPVFGHYERLLGFASLSMTHSAIAAAESEVEENSTDEQPLSLITFDRDGEILTASSGIDGVSAFLPASHSIQSFVGQAGQSFLDRTVAGQERAFAVVPLSPGNLYLMGSWPADRLDGGGIASGFPALTFPMLMWAASLMVAWIAAESQVLRHVRALRDSITAFAGGDRKVKPLRYGGAASELREAGIAYEKMTEAILHDEAHLENTIHQKEVLLREVHHRVKNNLQLIASILNMQLRTARSPEARQAMKSVQERVLSLATIHRELYQTTGLTDIRADELLPRIIQHIMKIGASPERPYDLEMQIEDIRLTPDQAVPLALFVTEGMTNVVKYSWRMGRAEAKISVNLTRQDDGQVHLSMSNSTCPQDKSSGLGRMIGVSDDSDGFGSKLLDAFAQQLEGEIEKEQEGDAYRLSLTFLPHALHTGEERGQPATESL